MDLPQLQGWMEFGSDFVAQRCLQNCDICSGRYVRCMLVCVYTCVGSLSRLLNLDNTQAPAVRNLSDITSTRRFFKRKSEADACKAYNSGPICLTEVHLASHGIHARTAPPKDLKDALDSVHTMTDVTLAEHQEALKELQRNRKARKQREYYQR